MLKEINWEKANENKKHELFANGIQKVQDLGYDVMMSLTWNIANFRGELVVRKEWNLFEEVVYLVEAT